MDLDAVVQRMVEAPSKPDDQVSTAQKQTTRISTFVSQTVTTIITARTNALGHITSGVSELPSSSSVSSPGRPAASSQSAVADCSEPSCRWTNATFDDVSCPGYDVGCFAHT
jgi:hypothetical protein